MQDPFFDYIPAGTEEKWANWFFHWKHLQKRSGFIGNVISESQRLLDMLPDFFRRHYPGPVVEGVFLEGVNFKEFFERNPGALVVLNIPYLDPATEAEQIGAYAFFLQFTRNWLTANGCRFVLTTHPDTFVAIMHQASDYFSVASNMIQLVDLKALIERAQVPLPEPVVPQAKLDALAQAQADVQASAKEDKGYHLFHRLRELKCLADLARWSEVLDKANALMMEAEAHGDPSIVEDTMGWQATAHLRLHQHHTALRIANALLTNPEIDASSAVYWEALSVKAEVLYENGELIEAKTLLEQLVAHWRRRNEEKLAKTLISQGNLKATLGALDEAKASYEEAEAIGDLRSYGSIRVLARTGKALIQLGKGEPIEAFKRLREAERIAREIGDAERLIAVLQREIGMLAAWGKVEESKALLSEVLVRLSEISDIKIRAVATLQVALALEREGKRDQAIEALLQAREVFHQIHDQENEGEVLQVLALLWAKNGANNAALRGVDAAIQCSQAAGNEVAYAQSISLKSQVLLELKSPAQAVKCSEEALEILRRVGDKIRLMHALCDHARCLGLTNRIEEALLHVEEALEVAQASGIPMDIARASIIKAAILAGAGRIAEANHWDEKAISIYRQLGDIEKLTTFRSSQAQFLWQIKHHQAAIEILRTAIQEVSAYPGYQKQLDAQLQEYLATTAHDTSAENTDPPSPPGATA